MTHMTYGGPILDAHCHIMEGDGGPDGLREMERQHGYGACAVLALESMGDAAQNARCFAYKLCYPESYVLASLNPADGDFRTQAERLLEIGADGFKMIEGKPDVYVRSGLALNDAAYDGFYSLLEERGVPLLLHAGDPPEFWEPERAPAFALRNDWLYNKPGYPTLEQLRSQVEDVVTRYPALRLILAHFYFLGHDGPAAAAFLDAHPNVFFDICPGIEMYSHFSGDTAYWRNFFLRYSDRLLFGTDNANTADVKDRFDKGELNRAVHNFLQLPYTFTVWTLTIRGIALPREALERIYAGNARRLLGERPRAVQPDALAAYCEARLHRPGHYGLTAAQRQELAALCRRLRAVTGLVPAEPLIKVQ